jgi:hypothetical protein
MSDLSKSNEELVAAFADLSRQQGAALETEDMRQHNRLFDKLRAIRDELRSRGAEAQKLLIPLLEQGQQPSLSYAAAQLRFNAAVGLKVVAPELAHATLESLSIRGPLTYRGMAGMSLSLMDQTTLKPS